MGASGKADRPGFLDGWGAHRKAERSGFGDGWGHMCIRIERAMNCVRGWWRAARANEGNGWGQWRSARERECGMDEATCVRERSGWGDG